MAIPRVVYLFKCSTLSKPSRAASSTSLILTSFWKSKKVLFRNFLFARLGVNHNGSTGFSTRCFTLGTSDRICFPPNFLPMDNPNSVASFTISLNWVLPEAAPTVSTKVSPFSFVGGRDLSGQNIELSSFHSNLPPQCDHK